MINTYIVDGSNRYFFDAVFRTNHTLSNKISESDSDSGNTKGDRITHSADVVSFDIGASDCVTDSSGSRSKKVFDILAEIRDSRRTVTLITRFRTYNNMAVEAINVADDYTTMNVLKATVNMRELVEDEQEGESSSKHTTNFTNSGQQSAQSGNQSILHQFGELLNGK